MVQSRKVERDNSDASKEEKKEEWKKEGEDGGLYIRPPLFSLFYAHKEQQQQGEVERAKKRRR